MDQSFSSAATARLLLVVGLLAVCCFELRRGNYFYDLTKLGKLNSMSLSAIQIFLALAILLFWAGLKIVLWGL